MIKKCLVAIMGCCWMIIGSAQTLFTYGKYSVDVKEFLRAYNKNNTQPVTNKAQAIRDYLDLYIKSRLKIREAYERGYDKLPQIKSEVDNLHSQIADNYMNDPETTKRLSKEAFERSLKDIHVAHIFISIKDANGNIDTTAARLRAAEIIKRLQKGEDFFTLAEGNSDDPSAKTNRGDMGFITVFTLPYEFENIIYSTPSGKYSMPHHSKIGYHIFKNLGERKALGKIKAQQILLAFPPGIDEAGKKEIASRADSIYRLLLAGDDFGKLAATFSNDYISAVNSGTMPDIGVGQYDQAFENELWALPKDGATSHPFTTSHGWHIVKRISLKPVITDPNDKANQQDLQQKISADGRWKMSRDFIYDRVIKKAGYKKYPYKDEVLWALSDSLLENKPMGIGRNMKKDEPLFTIGDTTLRIPDWITYAQVFHYKPDGSGRRPYDQIMEEFVHSIMFNYYRDHLEDFNAEFRSQMNELREGNLFFEIMQQEVWNKAQNDSVALLSLYNTNKKKYIWKESADAVLFFSSDETVANTVYEKLKKNPADWRPITEAVSEKVVADSARYEWLQIPNLDKMKPVAGMITTPLVNKNDNSASFAYIVNVYPQPVQRSFPEAKGLVINDYQNILEDQWGKTLKKKYPVVVNQKVLNGILK
jgi:peptidyl-prolyl cis-trans isomerase SurA